MDIHCIDAAPGCGGMEESSCQIMQYYCYLCVFSLSMRCTMCRGSKCGPFLCKSRISSKHLFDKRFLIFFMGICLLWQGTELLKTVTVFVVQWIINCVFEMTLYTIYESSGEIYELKDSGECGGQIGVSSLFVFPHLNWCWYKMWWI